MLSPDELKALDNFRFEHRMPSRAAAVRELLRQGLGVTADVVDNTGITSGDPAVCAMRVLVVDDLIVLLAESWLEDLGCQVETALNGTEALAKVNDGEFSVEVLITDVNMPDMSGYELAKRAAAVRPGLKVVQMSGAAGNPHGLTLIRKPFFRDDLRRVIQSDATR